VSLQQREAHNHLHSVGEPTAERAAPPARTDAARTDSLDELIGQQAAEIQRLRARVEKQARLLEDRLGTKKKKAKKIQKSPRPRVRVGKQARLLEDRLGTLKKGGGKGGGIQKSARLRVRVGKLARLIEDRLGCLRYIEYYV
jgi:hypothetical protein